MTAGTLETIEKGVETSYRRVFGTTCGEAFVGDVANPSGINVDLLKENLIVDEDEAGATVGRSCWR